MPDLAYLTITAESTSRLKVKGSRFICHIVPAATESQAMEHIGVISGKHPKATHNCFAYRILVGNDERFRFHDDGEPSGTAGKPIYSALKNKDLMNIACVVTRYFGGTKLGRGGLIRAYSQTVVDTIELATTVRREPQDTLAIRFPYELVDEIMAVISVQGVRIIESKYSTDVSLQVQLPTSRLNEFVTSLLPFQSKGLQCLDKDLAQIAT